MGPETEFKVGDTVVGPGSHPFRVTAVGEYYLLVVGSISDVEDRLHAVGEQVLVKSKATKAPEIRLYEITTERRLAKKGEVFVDRIAGGLDKATFDFDAVIDDVVTGVRPL